MSYCRFGGDSDVYMFHSVEGFIECCSCKLTEPEIVTGHPFFPNEELVCHLSTILSSREDAIIHLMEHKKAGHEVDRYAIHRLVYELLYNNYPLEEKEKGEDE